MRAVTLARLFIALLVAGCAGVHSETPQLPVLDGPWVGDIAIRAGDLGSTGPRDGELRLLLKQHGNAVTGRVDGPGLHGTLRAALRGDELAGTAALQVVLGAGTVDFGGTVYDDRIEALLDNNPVTLRRPPPDALVLMKNPKTEQVIQCQGSRDVVDRCVTALEQDGWKRLTP